MHLNFIKMQAKFKTKPLLTSNPNETVPYLSELSHTKETLPHFPYNSHRTCPCDIFSVQKPLGILFAKNVTTQCNVINVILTVTTLNQFTD